MYHPWDDDKGATTGQRVVVVVRGGLLPAGNDETDGLLRPLQPKERGSVPQEGRARLSQGRGSLMKCRHYRYRTKPTSTPADSA